MHHNAKLTDAQVKDIRWRRFRHGVPLRQLASEFNVSKSTVWQIVNNETHVSIMLTINKVYHG